MFFVPEYYLCGKLMRSDYKNRMINKIQTIREQIETIQIESVDQLEQFRLAYVSRKGVIAELFEGMKSISPDERRAMGAELNQLKTLAETKFKEKQAWIEEQALASTQVAPVDLTLPVYANEMGSVHPLTLVRNRIIEIFGRMGFAVADGPEIEDDWHNFGALNFPANHPAREMQDTFFIRKGEDSSLDVLLRTHTSGVQVRMMEKQKPPIRAIMPGRVYRNEAISARAHCFFHQIEGLYIDENVSFRDLKNTLYYFVKELFGTDVKVRFRASYFPFTEPSAEMDISCLICKGDGCQMCKHTGWVEILGSGMVDPNVLTNCGIDAEKFTGFAFGMGIERITNLLYQVRDLRLFSENDVRFLRQFGGVS